MNRLLTFLLPCVLGASVAPTHAAEPPKPNILIILTDDQGYGDLGCYGLTAAKTPHLDTLAAEGTRFTSFYSQHLCGPARSALLTGRYPSRSGGWSMPATEITFAELMRKEGYATACIGKWDVSNRKAILERMPLQKGFDYYYGPLGANDGGRVILHENNTLLGEDKDLASLSRRYTDKSIAWLTQHQTRNQEQGTKNPFLLYLCHTMMHTVINASPEFRDQTGNGLYADTLQELDHECGRLLAALDKLGLRENTLVIFTTDNGAWSNDAEKQNRKNAAHVPWSKGPQISTGSNVPLREGKGSDYEGGVRVPCLVRWPGKVPAGRVSDAIFATLDFMPTFAALCGFTAPQDRVLDGFDQSDLLLGKSEIGSRDHYFYHSGTHGVRQGPWKLLKANRWPADFRGSYPKDRGSNEVELYNLGSDLSETKNLAAQHPEIVARLSALKLPEEKVAEAKTAAPQPAGKAKGKAKATAPSSTKAAPTFPSRSDSILNYRETAPEYVFDTIPFWWKGEFHLFYLNGVTNDAGEKIGVKWSHAKTRDYVRWEKLPDALLPGDVDANVWTGSLIEKDGVFHLFYTGKSRPEKPDPKGDQKVMVATSTDLVTFTKQPQRTFYADGKFHWSKAINGPLKQGMGRDETFRDPEVTWIPQHNEYWMLLHSRHPQTQEQQFGLYRSDDLIAWTPRAPLQTVGTGRRNLDCPDLFPLGGHWHLTFSGCRTASADHPEGPFSPHRSYEHNHFVGKVTFDDKGRALTVATVRPGVGFTDQDGKTTGGLGGRASMVREFYLTEEGRLAQRPLSEVLAAFSKTTHTLDDLAKAIVTGQPERTAAGLRLTGGKETTRLRLSGVREDFLAEFSVTLAADSVFRVNFRQSGPQTYFFEASTKDNHLRIGTPWHHSDSNKEFADRDLKVPVGKPIRVCLFATGDIIECFIEDHVALTLNAYDLHGDKLVTQVTQGSATIHDFRIATLKPPILNQQSDIRHRPDVLFIVFDDLNTWSTLFDKSNPIKTPHLERLAARGAFFTRAYCAAPACNPSRAATLSGLHPITSGLYNNPDKLEAHHRDTVFLPQYFQQHGYRTWGISKILHGEPLHSGDPARPIFQKFVPMDKSYRPAKKLNGPTDGPGRAATYDWGQMTSKLADDITIEQATAWLNEPQAGPAFQAVGIFSPHLPHYARAEHFVHYPQEKPLLPPMPKDDFDDISAAGRSMSDFQKDWNRYLFESRDRGDLGPLSKLVQSYQAAATYGDEMLGRLLDALDATGRAGRTVIVLWSDHGYHLGDKDSVVKFTLWEQATRVPLLIVAPGVTTPGTRIETPVSLVDLYPTLLELAGLPAKPGLDGASLVPLLKNPSVTHSPVLTTWLRGNHAVRSRDWRYIRYTDGSEELYADTDPWNHTNLASRPGHAAILAEHRKWLPKSEAPQNTPSPTAPKDKAKTKSKAITK